MRAIVCGGRDYDDRGAVYQTLDGLNITELAHGACKYGGADILAEDWAKSREVPYRGYPAKTGADGHVKGPARNQWMLDDFGTEAVTEAVVAFPGGRGTADMVRRAKRAGIPVIEVPS